MGCGCKKKNNQTTTTSTNTVVIKEGTTQTQQINVMEQQVDLLVKKIEEINNNLEKGQ
jgi:ribosomal protein S15P/S13E